MSIFDKQQNKVKKFAKVTKGKKKKDIRKAEEALLKPEHLETYDGEEPKHRSELASRTALIVFKDKHQQELIGEIFAVRTSIQGATYITDISLLETIAQAVRDGDMRVVDNKIVPVGEPDEPTAVHSMEEFQAEFFTKDVGRKCFNCGRKYKKKINKYVKKATKKIQDNLVASAASKEGMVVSPVAGTVCDTKSTTEHKLKKLSGNKRKRRSLK